jgi:hypothetical protein
LLESPRLKLTAQLEQSNSIINIEMFFIIHIIV